MGRGSTVHVSVRALPRISEIPLVECKHVTKVSHVEGAGSGSEQTTPTSSSSSPNDDEETGKLAMAGALSWKKDKDVEQDHDLLRKALAKCAGKDSAVASTDDANNEDETEENSLMSRRSDSMDSMLGDSLLDPPQSLQKFPPKRYQSPSRCGSPSLETPEHLLFGDSRRRWRPASDRCARQDLLRRRDINHYYGLHPRLLHSGGPRPKLSLPLFGGNNSDTQVPIYSRSQAPVRPPFAPRHAPLDDRMQIRCTIPGKHNCSLEEEDELRRSLPNATASTTSPSSAESWTHEYSLQSKESKSDSSSKRKRSSSLREVDETGIEKDAAESSAFMSDKFL